MAERIRTHDWERTALGSLNGWSERLKLAVETVLDSPAVATLVCGPERILVYNDAAAHLYGARHPAALGRSLPTTFPEGWRTVAPFYDRAFAGETVRVIEQPLDTRGDSAAANDVFDAWLTPVRDSDGNIAAVHMIGIEVSARLDAQSAIRDDEARLRALVVSGAATIYRMSPDWSLMYQLDSRSFLASTTEPIEDWPDKYILPEDRPAVFAAIRQAIDSRSTFALEHRVAQADGSVGWVSSRAVPMLGRDGEIVEWFGTGTDITDRRRAEAALQASEERQGFLLSLSDELRPIEDPTLVQAKACELLAERLGVDRAYFVEINELAGVATVERDYVRGGAPSLAGRHPISSFAWAVAILRRGECHVISDTRTSPLVPEEDRAASLALQIGGNMGAPLIKGGRLVGALCVTTITERSWTDEEVSLLRDVAERIWAAIERARAEAGLRASEARLAAAFDSVPVGVAVIDASGATVTANAEYRRFLPTGLIPSRDAARVARWRAWDEDGRSVDPANFPGARALRGESTIPGQELLYTDDGGREIWTSVATAPIRDEQGRVTGVVTTIADIDDAKRGGDALRESEERLRQFGEASQDVLWIRDAEMLQWQYLTPAFEAIYGLSRDEALHGNNFRTWLDLIVPEDRETAVEAIRRVRQGEWVTFDYRVRRPVDGTIRWLRNTDFPIVDAAGEVTLIGGVGHDLTELREAELRLQTLMSGIPQLVWRAIDGGRWTWASPQWTEFTGQAESASHDYGWLATLHPDDRNAACKAWDGAIERGGIEIEYRLCSHETHAYRWFQTRATAVRDQSGGIVEWLGTSTDIQELRALQGRQQVMVQELQHRTRNLITVVGALSTQTMKNAASLGDFDQRFGQRLAALSRVQGLLSHLSAGKRISFDELLRSELSGLGAPDDRVTLDGPAGVPLRSGTVQTFSLALHELATNALKYGALAGSGGHLTVRWSVSDGDEGWPRLQVDWRESGVALTHVEDGPRRGGYGRQLIERALPYQLDADTTYEITADGVHCTIDVPISTVQTEANDQLGHDAA